MAGANSPAPFGTAGAGAGSAVRTAGYRATSGRRPHRLRPGGSNPNPVRRDRPLRRTSEAADCRSDPFRPTGRSTAKGSCDRTTGAVVRGTESLLTLRWSGMDSNVQFRARWATVCGFVRVGSDGPAHGHPSSCRPRRTARVSGGGPGRRHSPPGSGGRHTKVALSAVRAHRGTEGSNPFPSTEESANFQSLTAKQSRKRCSSRYWADYSGK